MSAAPMVKAEAVRKSFGRLEVLRGIELEVQPKEVMCVIGPSGSGKSTFLRCINHLEKIDAGRLSVDGELVGEVLDVMRRLAADGMTMIVVTHEMGFARGVGDTLVFMDGGVIVESGKPRELLANPQQERTRSFLSKVL